MPTYPKNQSNPPDTLVRTGHSLTIIANGKAIGLINNWNPQQSRQITPIYEINSETSGLILENVPGNLQNLTIAVSRYDIWPDRMENVFGTTNLVVLANQKSPFTVQERWISPTGGLEVWLYEGCWFTNVGRAHRSDDTRLVNVNATIQYVHISKLNSLEYQIIASIG